MMIKIILPLLLISVSSFAAVITGVIQDQNGSPIAGAVISIPELNITKNADSNGNYSLQGVKSGTYDVLFGAKNYQTAYLRDVTFDGTALVNDNSQKFKMDLTVNSSASIQQVHFVIPEGVASSPVKVILFDMRGRQISELVNDNYSAGFHSVTLPKSLAKGVYAVQMRLNDKSISRKMITY